MHLCDLSSDDSDPAHSSVGKLVTQNMKVFPKCLKNQCWKQLNLFNSKAKGTNGIRLCIKQLHIYYQTLRHVWDV